MSYGVDGFFRETAVPAVRDQPRPEPTEPDPEEFARTMARYGIEQVGPPPTLESATPPSECHDHRYMKAGCAP